MKLGEELATLDRNHLYLLKNSDSSQTGGFGREGVHRAHMGESGATGARYRIGDAPLRVQGIEDALKCVQNALAVTLEEPEQDVGEGG